MDGVETKKEREKFRIVLQRCGEKNQLKNLSV